MTGKATAADLFEAEPPVRWTKEDLDSLLRWAVAQGASDVSLISRMPVWINVHGQWRSVTQRNVETPDIESVLVEMTRQNNAVSRVQGGADLDFSYEVKEDRLSRRRFRVNASACSDGTGLGLAIVLRSIPAVPPKLAELDVEPEIVGSIFPANGLVLVTGVMGSGKSTLLAAVIREIRETQARMVRSYESPIEFDLMGIANPKGPLVQMDIPLHLREWENAPRNASRSSSNIILVGESNDRRTLRGMLQLTEMGVAAYTTVHTRNVAAAPSRIVDVFAGGGTERDERMEVKAVLCSSLRLIIHQRLVPALPSGRVALREFLIFDETMRREIQQQPLDLIEATIQAFVNERGQTLLQDATAKFRVGRIAPEIFHAIQDELGSRGKENRR